MTGPRAPLTPEQLEARRRWEARWNLPILLAALLPLFVTSARTHWVEVAVGVGSWLVFLIDLVVQRRIVPDYIHRRAGRVDLTIVLLTFPYYLIPGISGSVAILLLARLARVARVFLATAGLRRFAARLGKVAIVAGVVLVVASLGAYQAEPRPIPSSRPSAIHCGGASSPSPPWATGTSCPRHPLAGSAGSQSCLPASPSSGCSPAR